MIWEATLWSLLSMAAPALVRHFNDRIRGLLGGWYEPAANLSPWLHGLLIPFLALLLGSTTAGGLGLRVRPPAQWPSAILALLSGLVIAWSALRIRPLHLHSLIPAEDVLHEEPRWALYRATGGLWTGSLAIGSVVGFGLAVAELSLAYLPWREDGPPSAASVALLMRAAFSCAIYLVSGNFWLALGLQAGILLLAHRSDRRPVDVPAMAPRN